LRGHSIQNINSDRPRLEKALAPVKTLSKALGHAERISTAYDHAERVPSDGAASIIGRAFQESPYANLSADDLFEVSCFGNINPVALWHLTNEHILSCEVARCIGRVQAGAKAVLPPQVQ